MMVIQTLRSAPAIPRWSTRRRLERPTYGPYWASVAAKLGKPYMPWQQAVADIAGEVTESGQLAYNEVVLLIPRQSGKTSLVLPVVVGRAEAKGDEFGGRQRMVYTAQTREDGRQKWQEDYVYDVEHAKAMRGRYRKRIASGSENLLFHSSGSSFFPVATKETSGHGKVLDMGILDEAFAQTDDAVENAWLPAMITRRMAQYWVMSTAGTANSTYFRDKVDAGRLAAMADIGYGTAYVEYSAPENHTDYEDESVWWDVMPALGYTQSLESMRAEFARSKLPNFRRAFLNQWVDKEEEQILPAEQWRLMTNPHAIRASRPVLTVDVSYGRDAATVALGFEQADGTVTVRLARYAAGTAWLVPYVMEKMRELDTVAVVIDGAGPAKSIAAELTGKHFVDVRIVNASEMAGACGMFYDGVEQQKFAHYGEQPLQDAVAGAARRELGDAWAWTRKVSERSARTDICPLVAVTLAYWAQTTMGEAANYDFGGSFG